MYEKLSKAALLDMAVSEAILLVIGEIAVGGVYFFLLAQLESSIFRVAAIVLAVIILVTSVASPLVRYNRYRYKIDEESIDIIEGYLFINRNIVPIERLHKLEISCGPVDRLCGLSKVSVTTAGGDVMIRFLENDKAEEIAESLKKKINQIAIEQRQEAL